MRHPGRVAAGRAVVAAAGAVALLVAGLAGCGASGRARAAPARPGPRSVYVALGDGISTGEGTSDRLRAAWPQLFFRDTLPVDTVFVNVALPGDTAADALADQLPEALALRPTVATLAFFEDAAAGTPPEVFASELRTMVRDLGSAGATVLVATLPPLRGVDPAQIAAYNAAIRTVARDTGARLVDLAPAVGTDPELLTAQQVDDTTSARIARAFAAAWRAGKPRAPGSAGT